MNFLLNDKEIDEIKKEIELTEERNLENLKKTSQRLNDILLRSPQQLPIVLLIRKELNEFQKNIDIGHQDNLNLCNIQKSTEKNLKVIKEQSNKIYNIFNNMYVEYFHGPYSKQIESYSDDFQEKLITKIIKESQNLLKITDKNDNEQELDEKINKNTPKYWPLRIREALFASFIFDSNDKMNEIIEYFEANCQLFVFISKLKRTCDELDNNYKILFSREIEENTKGKKNEVPYDTKMILDIYIQNLLSDFDNNNSCSNFFDLIDSKVDFHNFSKSEKKDST